MGDLFDTLVCQARSATAVRIVGRCGGQIMFLSMILGDGLVVRSYANMLHAVMCRTAGIFECVGVWVCFSSWTPCVDLDLLCLSSLHGFQQAGRSNRLLRAGKMMADSAAADA